MTQPNKHGRSMKMARINARRKLKRRLKRKDEEKFAARTGRQPASA
jgi:hypothetical protein